MISPEWGGWAESSLICSAPGGNPPVLSSFRVELAGGACGDSALVRQKIDLISPLVVQRSRRFRLRTTHHGPPRSVGSLRCLTCLLSLAFTAQPNLSPTHARVHSATLTPTQTIRLPTHAVAQLSQTSQTTLPLQPTAARTTATTTQPPLSPQPTTNQPQPLLRGPRARPAQVERQPRRASPSRRPSRSAW